MALLSINKIQKVMIYPLLMVITHILDKVLIDLISSNMSSYDDMISYNDIEFIHKLFITYIMFFSESLAIVLYFIQRKRTFGASRQKMEMIPGKFIDKFIVFLLITLVFAVDCISTFVQIYLSDSALSFFDMILRGVTLFLATLLSMKILHYKYYRHHWFGFIILLIGLIIITTNTVYFNYKTISSQSIWYIIVNICISYIWSACQEVNEKYIMDVKYVSPFAVVGLEGIGGLVSMTIIYPILAVFVNKEFGFGRLINYMKFIFCKNPCIWIYYIILIISISAFNTYKVLTIHHFYPTYNGLSDVLGDFIYWIVLYILDKYFDIQISNTDKIKSSFFINIISYLIMTLGIIIYLEIVQINCFGLNTNTREQIKRRTSIDIYQNIFELPLDDEDEIQ